VDLSRRGDVSMTDSSDVAIVNIDVARDVDVVNTRP
jgi:hypothetical protein